MRIWRNDWIKRFETIMVPSVQWARSQRGFLSLLPNICNSWRSKLTANEREPWLPVAMEWTLHYNLTAEVDQLSRLLWILNNKNSKRVMEPEDQQKNKTIQGKTWPIRQWKMKTGRKQTSPCKGMPKLKVFWSWIEVPQTMATCRPPTNSWACRRLLATTMLRHPSS